MIYPVSNLKHCFAYRKNIKLQASTLNSERYAVTDNRYTSTDKTYLHNTTVSAQNQMFITNIQNKISFKGYQGDKQPLKKLFWICTGRNEIYEDDWTKLHIKKVNNKKWINAHPAEILRRTPEQTIQSLCTITKPEKCYPHIPSYIPSPDFGDKWGRNANYIEINPRAIAKYDGEKISEGLLNTMKLITAIPPSSNSFANCIILSQLYPAFDNDGRKHSSSLYCTDIQKGISKTLTSENLFGKMGSDEQVKAFNDMAHLLGFKTGFRLPLSSGQLKLNGKDFDWKLHEKQFIDACVCAINLGFDCIYFDSAKHITDKNHYCGSGDLPNKEQMAYMLFSIRAKSGRNDLSFVGEKCYDSAQYKEMGFTAGTDWGKADYFESVLWESKKQACSREYAAGPEVSNDNDCGEYGFKTRLNRLHNCLFAHENINNKLPSYMQMHDIFPLSPYTNTHELMLNAKQMKGSDAWTECERHYDGIFDTGTKANFYRNNVYNIFEEAIKTFG